jgi:hypothetical protein
VTKILGVLAQGNEDAAAIYWRAIEDLHSPGMTYGCIGTKLGISRGTVQKHAEHASATRRARLDLRISR